MTPHQSEALLAHAGYRALVVLAAVAIAVGLANWVLDMIAEGRKDPR